MERPLDHELSELKERLLTMASLAEAAVNDAVRALVQRDLELALRVRENDLEIDRLEIEVDDLAIHLLAKAPLASDLRFVAMAMKISQNLERVGDEAAKIAKRARDLCHEAPLTLDVPLAAMAERALGLLKRALDAFVQHDAAAARALIPKDKEVNALHKDIQHRLTEQMRADADTILRCLNWVIAAKSLERIADHAKNIAEEVVYLCEAQDIRHPRAMQSQVEVSSRAHRSQP
ncbi:MAG: phosphate signaling complex protein PhoU [Verrucomicrobiales bacterium]|nr:phosphate signaling complex protein PhoU [Verrucomicrobiales bacterium]